MNKLTSTREALCQVEPNAALLFTPELQFEPGLLHGKNWNYCPAVTSSGVHSSAPRGACVTRGEGCSVGDRGHEQEHVWGLFYFFLSFNQLIEMEERESPGNQSTQGC